MQLTADQLDRAARKLCELWQATRKEYVPHSMAKQHIALVCLDMEPTIAAIVHAVTRQNDELIFKLTDSLMRSEGRRIDDVHDQYATTFQWNSKDNAVTTTQQSDEVSE